MLIFLDTNIIIYLIEQPALWGSRAMARIVTIRAMGHPMAVSDLVRLECRVKPLSQGMATVLADYDKFFAASDVRVITLTTAVIDRATMIRSRHGYKLADALHLPPRLKAAAMFS